MKVMDGMVSRKRTVDGKPTSLCDLGYCDVGLDDNWQLCGSYGQDTFTYHNEAGYPVVNTQRFPDFISMTNYAHSLNLTAGWYLNNCICQDHCGSGTDGTETKGQECYAGDVAALYEFGFDGVKLDGCGKQRSLDLWSSLIEKSGKAMMIENCHWGQTVPNSTWCPFNFYRTSGDIVATYGSVVFNLLTTVPFAQQGLSYPGCWAYPDMLEVGVAAGAHGSGDQGLTIQETRSHFGAWCIVSSPLTLSHDINNDTLADMVWPIISNKEAIAINQAWAGHSGSPFTASSKLVTMTVVRMVDGLYDTFETSVASSQAFYKPLQQDGSQNAVLLMNHDTSAADLTVSFANIPSIKTCSSYTVRDVWARKDVGSFTTSYTAKQVDSHDSAFITVTCN